MAKDSFCTRLYEAVSGLCMECIIAVLVVLDGLAITAELLIRLDILQVPGGAPTDTPVTSVQNVSVNATPTQDPDPGGSICRRCINMVEPIEITYCVAHYASVVIGGLFFVEMFLRVVSGRSKVCKDFVQIGDSLVVVVLVTMEILFTLFWDEVLCYHPAVEAATYIVLFRLCRVPRACTVSKRVFSDKVDIELHYLMKAKKKAEEKGAELRDKVDKQQREIDFLNNQLKETKDKMSALERGGSEICNGHVPDGKDKPSTEGVETLYSKPIKRSKVNGTASNHNSPQHNSPQHITEQNPGGYTTIIHTTYQRHEEAKPTKDTEADMVNGDIRSSSKVSALNDANDVTDSTPHDGSGDVHDGAGPHGDSCSLDGRNSAYDSTDSAYLMDDIQKRKKVRRTRSDSALSTESKIAIRQLDIAIDPGFEGGIDNKSYEEDGEEAVQMRRLPVMAEYEGTRTYRSAEGVPLTDL